MIEEDHDNAFHFPFKAFSGQCRRIKQRNKLKADKDVHCWQRESEKRLCMEMIFEKNEIQWFDAIGWSMFPAFRAKQKIRISPLKGRPHIGQILVVIRGRKLLAHRVVHFDTNQNRYILKGDTLFWFDWPTREDEITGVLDMVIKGRRRVNLQPDPLLAYLSGYWGALVLGRFSHLSGWKKHILYLMGFFSHRLWLKFFGRNHQLSS